jgi:hypothetical protein
MRHLHFWPMRSTSERARVLPATKDLWGTLPFQGNYGAIEDAKYGAIF